MFRRKLIHIFVGFLLWFIPFVTFAQRYISGNVTDMSGAPIPDVHVFLANTTVGIATDTKGYYRLRIPGEGSYRLAASHVGYEPVFVDIKPGNNSLRLNLKMQEQAMDAVEVSAKVNFRKRDIDLFWETLLGMKSTKNTIYAVNPQDAFYKYDSKTSILRVTSRVPLEIINNETGYLIQFVLDEFTHDYKSRLSLWDGEYRFTELEPANDRQREVWEKNREETYRVSNSYFLKSLYNNTLKENGFLLIHEGKSSPFVLGMLNDISLATPEKYITQDSTVSHKTLHIEPYSEALILVSFGKPVTERDLGNVRLAQNRHKKWEMIGAFRNVLQTPEEPVQIFSDGTYMNRIQYSPFFSSQPITGLNMTLPSNFEPESVYGTSSPDIFAGTFADRLNNVAMRFTKQLIVSPQEKIHLHTDKPYYITGERIWFRVHVVNAAVHTPVWSVNCVYVELFDANDLAVSRVKIGLENGIFSGYIPIPKDIPEGNYTLRAYTNTMRNMDEDYFFMKNIHIGKPIASHIMQTSTETKTKKDISISRQPDQQLPEDDFDVSFYPEGGYALYGSAGRIAFKALQQNGSEIDVTGTVYDSRKNEITGFKTDVRGMGQFITAQRYARKSSYYNIPDRTISINQLKIPPSSLNQLLIQFFGVTVTDTSVYLLKFGPDKPVLWLVDDMPVGYEPPDYLMVNDIEQIDLLSSPINLAMFAKNGQGGVIAIHTNVGKKQTNVNLRGIRFNQTKRTQLFDAHIKRIMPLGFQKPAEFYAPKYDTPAQNTKPDLRTTIHWQPNLVIDKTCTATFSFYTADAPSTYTVVIEGVTDDGKMVYKRDKVVISD